jgi:hypothetical protein
LMKTPAQQDSPLIEMNFIYESKTTAIGRFGVNRLARLMTGQNSFPGKFG